MKHGPKIERIAESMMEKLLPKIRKTVPFNTGTKVHPDRSKYNKRHRQQWKQDLRREGRTAARIMSYPHRTQSFDYDCGATAVLTVMQYYGFNSDQLNEQTVFDSIGTDKNGTDNEGIEAGLLKMGMKYANVRTLEDIDRNVDAGYPVIVSVAQWIENGEPVWHYEVVIAQEGDRYIISDPWALTLVWVEKAVFEKMWYEPKGFNSTRWGVAVIGEPKFKGGLNMMDYKLAGERQLTAHLLEQINPASLPAIWQEELVMALVRYGYTMSEAILVAATACMRCRCVLAYELGLGYGYSHGSPEYVATDTECDLCRPKG